MKEVYVLRHGEKDTTGMLTERGMRVAEALRPVLPTFVSVISSASDRAIMTAQLLTGQEPIIDMRAGYASATPEASADINGLVSKLGISFLDAARQYNDPEVLAGIARQAVDLNTLIDELLLALNDDQTALIVSHDLTIAPAMGLRGMPAESIEPLSGYILSLTEGEVSVRPYSCQSGDTRLP